jgi:hypothetical protein
LNIYNHTISTYFYSLILPGAGKNPTFIFIFFVRKGDGK